eukprot:scaffold142509_cov30-Tisochrysis_lutea.AAC.3
MNAIPVQAGETQRKKCACATGSSSIIFGILTTVSALATGIDNATSTRFPRHRDSHVQHTRFGLHVKGEVGVRLAVSTLVLV